MNVKIIIRDGDTHMGTITLNDKLSDHLRNGGNVEAMIGGWDKDSGGFYTGAFKVSK